MCINLSVKYSQFIEKNLSRGDAETRKNMLALFLRAFTLWRNACLPHFLCASAPPRELGLAGLDGLSSNSQSLFGSGLTGLGT